MRLNDRTIANIIGLDCRGNRGVLVFLFFLLLFPAVLCHAQPRHGGELVMAVSSDPKTFNDIMASETTSSAVTSVLFEGLTTTDPFTQKAIPNLAQSWETSADGLQWTFHLRTDVTFFDGAPLTADDVLFTFNDLIYNPQVPNSSKDVFSIEGQTFKVEKIDTYTVRFTLPAKFAPFLRGMSQPILPKHKLAAAVKAGAFAFTWGINTPPHEIVGTGPFYLDQYRPGERLVFKRNPHYWKKAGTGDQLPYLDRLVFLIIADPDAALLKFIDGELDYVAVQGRDYPLLAPLAGSKNFKIYDMGPGTSSNFWAFNQNPGTNPKTKKPFVDPVKLSWFGNADFRRALAHAIDKQKIVQILFNGLGYPQEGPMSPANGFFYNPNVTKYAYDLNEARRLLSKAGFADRNQDGVLRDPQGHPVEFNIYTNTGGAEREQMAWMIRADLQKLGIKVNVKTLEFNSLVAKLMSSYDWDTVILGLTGGVEPHFGANVWQSSGQLHLWNPRQKSPGTDWEKRLDDIYNQGVQELDENKRKVLYDEYQTIAADQLPVIYTVLQANLFAVRQRFGNLKPSPTAGALHNLEELYELEQ